MPKRVPRIDSEALKGLRDAVDRLRSAKSGRMPLADIVESHSNLEPFENLVVDFGADSESVPIVLAQPKPEDPERVFRVLTPREREIARLVAEGLTNRAIADRLYLSLATVKDHVHNVLEKLELPNRASVAGLYAGTTPPSDRLNHDGRESGP